MLKDNEVLRKLEDCTKHPGSWRRVGKGCKQIKEQSSRIDDQGSVQPPANQDIPF